MRRFGSPRLGTTQRGWRDRARAEGRRARRRDGAVDRGRLTAGLARAAASLSGGEPAALDPERLGLMVTVYDRSGQDAESRLAAFVAERHELLAALFDAYADDSRANTLLAPDALLIFERLEHDPDRLKDVWRTHRPLDELEELANVFGVAI
jgi:hypothetical protein